MIINFQRVWAFAQAENKITFRLVRYWFFLVLSYLAGLLMYAYLSLSHTFNSAIAPSIGMLGPRYLLASIGFPYLIIFIFGIAFLAFEIRARDAREQMLGVLDTRPYSNIDLIFGRFLSSLMSSWIPLVIFVGFINILGLVIPSLMTFEPISIFAFLFFTALPTLMFCSALVFAFSLVIRKRILAVVISVLVIGGITYISVIAPYSMLASSVDLMGFSQQTLTSDINPSVSKDYAGWLQRIGVLFTAFAILFLSARLHPRSDSQGSSFYSLSAIVLGCIGIFSFSSNYMIRHSDINDKQQWLISHQASQTEVIPDIVSMKASVSIVPGDQISASIDLDLTATEGEVLDKAIFSLNPGFDVKKVGQVITDNSEQRELEFSFEHGLLKIQLGSPIKSGQILKLNIDYVGKPDVRFGYLDSHIDTNSIPIEKALIGLLGTENIVFSTKAVALMPGAYWLPSPGTDVSTQKKSSKDFYNLDLRVTLPKNWLAAGPGLRTEISSTEDEVTYQYRPNIEVPEVALIAGMYKSYAVEIDNINFELLVHPSHVANFKQLSEFEESFSSWIRDKLSLLNESGIIYPYKAFTIVEIPNALRGFGGGWRMDSTLYPPSMALMRESGLPTARLLEFNEQEINDQETVKIKKGNTLIASLVDYNKIDFTGGNIFNSFAKSLISHQTAGQGNEAIALEYILNQLTMLVLADARSYFSVERFPYINDYIYSAQSNQAKSNLPASYRTLHYIESNPDVWEEAFESYMSNIQPGENPALTLDMLSLRAGAVAQLIYDSIGARKSGQFIAKLSAEFGGEYYSFSDVKRIGESVSEDLGLILDDWIGNENGPAGFIVPKVWVFQLGNKDGLPTDKFPLQLLIKNDEEYTGYTRVSWVNSINDNTRTYSKPIRIEGQQTVQFGVTLSKPAYKVYLEPYASLNVEPLVLRDSTWYHKVPEWGKEYEGVRQITWWKESSDNRIIVDDLDSGFSILSDEQQRSSSFFSTKETQSDDQDLPLINKVAFPDSWSRTSAGKGWGKYRNTMVLRKPGKGNTKASYQANLTEPGKWKLEINLPNLHPIRAHLMGEWELEVVSGEEVIPVKFNAKASKVGWNEIGSYELSEGNVRVNISDKTEHIGIIADAIAWSKAE